MRKIVSRYQMNLVKKNYKNMNKQTYNYTSDYCFSQKKICNTF